PERLERLRHNLKAYLELPEARRETIARLDRDLRDLPAKKQERLLRTLERYADWLDQPRKRDPKLHPAIQEPPNSAARLALIKDQRDREWMAQQPKAYRDNWDKLEGAARGEFVTKLRGEERHKREQWLIAKRFWKELETKQPMPSRLSDFADAKVDRVKRYVEDYLLPNLTAAEKKQLEDAEGRWPDYPQALVEIASKHPSALPPKRPESFAELPLPVQHK